MIKHLKKSTFTYCKRNKGNTYLLIIFLGFGWQGGIAQSWRTDSINYSKTDPLFIESEIMLGKIVPVYRNYPVTKFQKSFFLNIGHYNNSAEKTWASFYKRPFTGASIAISDFGNKKEFGYGVTIMPYVIFHSARLDRPAWHYKFGLGASYFTKTFDVDTNPGNESVSSPLTWAFQLFFYRDILVRDRLRLKIGTGWLHGSNGHTELPNYGINSAMVSIAAQFFKTPVNWSVALVKKERSKEIVTNDYFFMTRIGLGRHELGGPDGPVGGPKKFVYTINFGVGKFVKDFIKLRTGVGFRYYEQFRRFIVENNLPDYADQPTWNASNIYLYIGSEFLMGHVSLDTEFGVNLYKPFYQEQYRRFEKQNNTERVLKTLFSQRLGLNYYLVDTSKKPMNNLSIGFHINANFGQADFTELSLAYTRRL